VTELVFVVTDFSPPESGGADSGRPRMPLLELLLARANQATLDSDWRAWFAARAAPAALCEFSLAAIVRAAFSGANTKPESTGYWLATPVHLFAGLDSVHVHPAGLLDLAPSEQEALVNDFARVFFDSPWRLESLDRRELLLAGPHVDADGADPSLYKGADPSPGLPSGPAIGTLRRLGSEIEMWLFEHAINRARAARGELPVTALWLWGAKAPQRPAAPLAALVNPVLYGHDAYAEALCRLQNRVTSGLSDALELIHATPMQLTSDTVVLVEGIAELEQRWLPAVMQALRLRRVSTVRLVVGRRLFSVSKLNLMRWWRASAPWWELLA